LAVLRKLEIATGRGSVYTTLSPTCLPRDDAQSQACGKWTTGLCNPDRSHHSSLRPGATSVRLVAESYGVHGVSNLKSNASREYPRAGQGRSVLYLDRTCCHAVPIGGFPTDECSSYSPTLRCGRTLRFDVPTKIWFQCGTAHRTRTIESETLPFAAARLRRFGSASGKLATSSPTPRCQAGSRRTAIGPVVSGGRSLVWRACRSDPRVRLDFDRPCRDYDA
jgi:hypothetical protein